jgi:hypothetical protein
VKVPFVPSGACVTERWGGMELNFYWTAADTAAALIAAGGSVLGLYIERIYRRLARR